MIKPCYFTMPRSNLTDQAVETKNKINGATCSHNLASQFNNSEPSKLAVLKSLIIQVQVTYKMQHFIVNMLLFSGY